eukprot:887309-Rhodomonas_salina.4
MILHTSYYGPCYEPTRVLYSPTLPAYATSLRYQPPRVLCRFQYRPAVRCSATALRLPYEIPGTDVAYAPTRMQLDNHWEDEVSLIWTDKKNRLFLLLHFALSWSGFGLA